MQYALVSELYVFLNNYTMKHFVYDSDTFCFGSLLLVQELVYNV